MLHEERLEGGVVVQKNGFANPLRLFQQGAFDCGIFVQELFDLRDLDVAQWSVGLSNQRAIKKISRKHFQSGQRVRMSVEKFLQLGILV